MASDELFSPPCEAHKGDVIPADSKPGSRRGVEVIMHRREFIKIGLAGAAGLLSEQISPQSPEGRH